MTLLWTPNWITPEDFRISRARTPLFVVGWNSGTILSDDRHAVIREDQFGGFTFHLTFKSDFWNSNSKFWRLGDIFEDVFVRFPDGGGPVSAGPVAIRVGSAPPDFNQALVLDMAGLNRTYFFMGWPMRPPRWEGQELPPFASPLPYTYQPP